MPPPKSASWFTRFEDEELDRIRAKYEKLAEQARAKLRQGLPDTGVPEVEAAETEETKDGKDAR